MLKSTATAVALGLTLAASACGSSSTPTANTSSSSSAATGTSSGLEGTWHADVKDLVSGVSSMPSTVSCSGPATLTFTSTMATDVLQIQCTVHGTPATGTITASANYTRSGNHLAFTNIQNTGSITVMGITIPFPSVLPASGADFTVNGNDLTFNVQANGTTIHQVYHRG